MKEPSLSVPPGPILGPAANESHMMRQIARGDWDAVVAIQDPYSTLVCRPAFRTLNDPDDARDVLHEVPLQIWRKASHHHGSAGKPVSR